MGHECPSRQHSHSTMGVARANVAWGTRVLSVGFGLRVREVRQRPTLFMWGRRTSLGCRLLWPLNGDHRGNVAWLNPYRLLLTLKCCWETVQLDNGPSHAHSRFSFWDTPFFFLGRRLLGLSIEFSVNVTLRLLCNHN